MGCKCGATVKASGVPGQNTGICRNFSPGKGWRNLLRNQDYAPAETSTGFGAVWRWLARSNSIRRSKAEERRNG